MLKRIAMFLTTAMISATSAYADEAPNDHFLALPETNIGHARMLWGEINAFAKETMGPGDRLTLMSADDGGTLRSMTLPPQNRYRLPKFRHGYLETDLQAVKSVLRQIDGKPVLAADAVRSDIPATLRAIAERRSGRNGTAQVLLIASPLQRNPADPATDMVDGQDRVRLPSDGFLVGSLQLSAYGQSTARDGLRGVTVHLCSVQPRLTSHEMAELGRFWAHYVTLRGGTLATFTEELSSCVDRFVQGYSQPLDVRPLAPNALPAMILATRSGKVDVLEIDERGDVDAALDRDRQSNADRVRDLEAQLKATTKRNTDLTAANKAYEQEARSLKTKLAAAQSHVRRLQDEAKILTASLAERDTALAKAREASAAIQSLLDDAKTLEGVTSFALFQEIPHPDLLGRNVTTGIEYALARYPQYTKAWCYLNATNKAGAAVHLSLGTRAAGASIIWETPTAKVLRDVKLNEAQIISARPACRFPG